MKMNDSFKFRVALCVLLGQLRATAAHSAAAAMMRQQMDEHHWPAVESQIEDSMMSTTSAGCPDAQQQQQEAGVMELADAIIEPAKGKLMMHDDEDDMMSGKMFEVQQDKHGDADSMSDLAAMMMMDEHKQEHQQQQQQQDDCPMSHLAYDIMEHGLYFGSKSAAEMQQQPQQPDMFNQHEMQHMMQPPVEVVIPQREAYSKSALAAKRRHLAARFPIKNSKLTTASRFMETKKFSQLPTDMQNDVQVEQQQMRTWDNVVQEPMQIVNSVFSSQPHQQLQPEPQVQQVSSLQTVSSLSRQMPMSRSQQQQTTTTTTTNETTSTGDSTSPSSGVFNDGFDLEPRQPIGIVQGQRARESFLMASNAARALREREQRLAALVPMADVQ